MERKTIVIKEHIFFNGRYVVILPISLLAGNFPR